MPATIPNTNILNRMKEKTSKAYIAALLAKVNYTFQEFDTEGDEMGIDYAIFNKLVGSSRTVASEINEIKVQLKSVSSSSSSMFEETEDSIRYNLSSPLESIGGNLYIFLVQLLEEENHESWIEVEPEQLKIKKKAYYFKVEGRLERGFITIPKTNVLDHQTLPALFTQPL